uniref:Cyclin n=1 Tax=Zooxanthella nutricula TaxID=1333877 RepID=A0A7S2J040_9DINO
MARFCDQVEPDIGIRDFLALIRKRLRCSKECFILALIFIDRVVEASDIVISNLTVHRLLLTGVLIASKVIDDKGEDNASYAAVGGLTTRELNRLEASFLDQLQWRLHVRQQDYEWYRELACRVVSAA